MSIDRNRETEITDLEKSISIDASFLDDFSEVTLFEHSASANNFAISTHGQDSVENLQINKTTQFDHSYETELECAELQENAIQTQFDLSEVSPEANILSKNGSMTFEVADNSNSDLVKVSIEGTLLSVQNIGEVRGTADITIKGVGNDGKVHEIPFRIHVDPVTDSNFLYNQTENQTLNPWISDESESFTFNTFDDKNILDRSHRNLEEVTSSMVNTDSRDHFVKEHKGFFGSSSLEQSEWKESKKLYE